MSNSVKNIAEGRAFDNDFFNAGSNPENLRKAGKAMLEGKTDEAKQYLKDNMDSIEKYWKNPGRKIAFLVTLKVKCPEVYSEIVEVGKAKEKKDRMEGNKQDKGANLKKALLGDFYYADYAYGKGLKVLNTYYKGIQNKVLNFEDPNKGQDGFDRAV